MGMERQSNYGTCRFWDMRPTFISVPNEDTQQHAQACLHQPTTTQQAEWYEQRSPHTKAYERHLLKQLIGSTIADVSLKEKVGYDAVVGVLRRQVDTEVNWDEITNLGAVGIDEIAMRKGRKNYAAVITARQDDGEVVILAVLPDRKKSG